MNAKVSVNRRAVNANEHAIADRGPCWISSAAVKADLDDHDNEIYLFIFYQTLLAGTARNFLKMVSMSAAEGPSRHSFVIASIIYF